MKYHRLFNREKICDECAEVFLCTRKDAQFCSAKCRKRDQRRRNHDAHRALLKKASAKKRK
jgi:hypothetical protein